MIPVEGKGISGFLKLGALFVCLSFMFSGAFSAFQNETFVSEQDNGPVTAGEAPVPAVAAGEAEEEQVETPEELPWYGEPNGRGNDIFVPGSFWTIGAAVENATGGDRILVNEPFFGTEYVEDQIEVDKSLQIIGLGADVVTIDAEDPWVFHVTANDVVISGFTLEPEGEGIWVQGADSVNISECAMGEVFGAVIMVNESSSNVAIMNNSLYDAEHMIILNDTAGCSVLGNEIAGQYVGIMASNTTGLEIGYNEIDESIINGHWRTTGIGVWLRDNTEDVRIHHNFIGDSETSGIAVDGYGGTDTHHVWIEDNTIDSAYIHGVNITNGANEIRIFNNTFDDIYEMGYVYYADAIYVSNASQVYIGSEAPDVSRGITDQLDPWGNDISGAERAITVVHGSEDVLVAGNSIRDCYYGLWLEDVPEAPATRSIMGWSVMAAANDIQWCQDAGVWMRYSYSTTLLENTIANNADYGVKLQNSSMCELKGNVIHSTHGSGVAVYLYDGSNYNDINDNDIRFNHDSGIVLEGNMGNSLVGNHVNANGLESAGARTRGGNEANIAQDLGANEAPARNEISSIPGTYPSAPQNIEVTYGLGYAYLEWDDPADGGDPTYIHTNIYRGTDPDSLTYVGSVDAPSARGVAGLEYFDYTVQSHQIYYYEVAAENVLGEGIAGNVAAFDPWPTFGHDAARQGLSEFPTDHNAGSVMWTYDTGNLLFGSAAVDRNGTLYVASYNNYLYAITPNGTGSFSPETPYTRRPPSRRTAPCTSATTPAACTPSTPTARIAGSSPPTPPSSALRPWTPPATSMSAPPGAPSTRSAPRATSWDATPPAASPYAGRPPWHPTGASMSDATTAPSGDSTPASIRYSTTPRGALSGRPPPSSPTGPCTSARTTASCTP